MIDPTRGDTIAVLGETTGGPALQRMRRQMAESEAGRKILEQRPRIRKETVEAWELGRLPDGTFGRAYLDFMDTHGYDADSRLEVRYVESEELAFVLQRYREVHDFLHVLCGLPPTVLGELALKWYEMVQTGLPMTALSAVVGPLRLSSAEAAVFRADLVPWAASAGRRAAPLLTIPVEELLATPLHDVRARFRVRPAPDVRELLRRHEEAERHASAVRGPLSVALGLARTGAAALGLHSPSTGQKRLAADAPPTLWGSWRA